MQYSSYFKSIAIIVNILVATILSTSSAYAQMYAQSVDSSSQGTMKNGSAVPDVRSNPNAVLGAPEETNADGTFFSLGFGGSVVISFGDACITNGEQGTVVIESTWPDYPTEYAHIEFSLNGTDWYSAGTIGQTGTVQLPAELTQAKYMRITDVSNQADFPDEIADGYDVDGVKVYNYKSEACVVEEDPEPTPTPTSNPNPEDGKHSALGKNGPQCTDNNVEVTYDAKENGQGRENVEVTFSYKGEEKKAKTNSNGRASVSYGFKGADSITTKATDGYPDQAVYVDNITCEVTPSPEPARGGTVLGATAPDNGKVLGSTSVLADTGVATQQLNLMVRMMTGFAIGALLFKAASYIKSISASIND